MACQTMAFIVYLPGEFLMTIGGVQGWTVGYSAGLFRLTSLVAGAGSADIFVSTVTLPGSSPYRVVVRRISTHGDLGLAPGLCTLWINGTEIGRYTEVLSPTPINPGQLLITNALPSFAGAIFSNLTFSPYAWSDVEAKAWGL